MSIFLRSKLAQIVFLNILFLGIYLVFPFPTHAFVQQTGGDGFVPIIYQDLIFNIFHHSAHSGDPLNPKFDIYCVERLTGNTCPGYPRYFSSTVGSSGSLGIGTPGTADIDTSYYPKATIEGSRMFYAAQRVGDNGIGCYDLSTHTNCGYTQLGTLAWSGVATNPARVDGVERVGNKIYSIGADLNVYCLDISTPASPVACAGQPYALNTGITAQMPAYNGTRFSALGQVVGNLIYISINYTTQSTPANARLTCFDSLTNARCAGWSSMEITGSTATASRSLFEFPNISGVVTAICATTLLSSTPQCWDTTTLLSVTPPPNLFSGITSPSAWIWDEVRVSNKSYFAVSAGSNGTFGMSVCYDFTIQTRCSGFGTGGVKSWDGLDGGSAINSGDTRDYGYSLSTDGLCMYGLGDAGVLWSFDTQNGSAPGGLTCAIQLATSPTTNSNQSSGGSPESCPSLSNFIAPTVIQSRRVDRDSIFFSWSPYSGTDRFNIRYGFTNGEWLYNTDVTGFSTTINDLPLDQPIWVSVAARNNCAIGVYGEPKQIGGPILPVAGVGSSENTTAWYTQLVEEIFQGAAQKLFSVIFALAD